MDTNFYDFWTPTFHFQITEIKGSTNFVLYNIDTGDWDGVKMY